MGDDQQSCGLTKTKKNLNIPEQVFLPRNKSRKVHVRLNESTQDDKGAKKNDTETQKQRDIIKTL